MIDALKRYFNTPEHVFCVLALAFGSAIAILNPPFQAPDESAHWWRAVYVTYGHIVATTHDRMPDSYIETVMRFHRDLHLHSTVATLRKEHILSLFEMPLQPKNTTEFVIASASIYNPVPYLPQIPSIVVGRLLGLSPIAVSYLGRLSNLLVWTFLTFLAIRITPVIKWAFVTLALMPMTIHQAASLSADSLAIGSAFLLVAYIFHLAFRPALPTIGRRQVGILVALLLLAILSKANFAFLLLLLLIPRERFASTLSRWKVIATAAGTVLGALSLWNYLNSANLEVARMGLMSQKVDSAKNLHFLYSHPLDFLRLVAATTYRFYDDYLIQFVGRLGWLNHELPHWLVYTYFGVLVCTAVFGTGHVKIRRKQKVHLLCLFAVGALLIFGALWVLATPGNNDHIGGVQGRYFIPIAGLFLAALPAKRLPERYWLLFTRGVSVFVMCALTVTTVSLLNRYYSPSVQRVILNDRCNYADAGRLTHNRLVSQSFTVMLPEVIRAADYEGYVRYKVDRSDAAFLNGLYQRDAERRYKLRDNATTEERKSAEVIFLH